MLDTVLRTKVLANIWNPFDAVRTSWNHQDIVLTRSTVWRHDLTEIKPKMLEGCLGWLGDRGRNQTFRIVLKSETFKNWNYESVSDFTHLTGPNPWDAGASKNLICYKSFTKAPWSIGGYKCAKIVWTNTKGLLPDLGVPGVRSIIDININIEKEILEKIIVLSDWWTKSQLNSSGATWWPNM